MSAAHEALVVFCASLFAAAVVALYMTWLLVWRLEPKKLKPRKIRISKD